LELLGNDMWEDLLKALQIAGKLNNPKLANAHVGKKPGGLIR
jgi:hypothetical protein